VTKALNIQQNAKFGQKMLALSQTITNLFVHALTFFVQLVRWRY